MTGPMTDAELAAVRADWVAGEDLTFRHLRLLLAEVDYWRPPPDPPRPPGPDADLGQSQDHGDPARRELRARAERPSPELAAGFTAGYQEGQVDAEAGVWTDNPATPPTYRRHLPTQAGRQ